MGNLQTAIRLYNFAAELPTQDPLYLGEAENMLGCIHMEQANFSQAMTFLEKAVALRPSMTGYRNNLAIAYLFLGRDRDALQSLRKAVLIEGDGVEGKRDRDSAIMQKNLVGLTKYLSTSPRPPTVPMLEYIARIRG